MEIDLAESANRHEGRPAESIRCRRTHSSREDKTWECEAAVSGRKQPQFFTDEFEIDGEESTWDSIKEAYFYADGCEAVGAELRDEGYTRRRREEDDVGEDEVHWSDEYDVDKIVCNQ